MKFHFTTLSLPSQLNMLLRCDWLWIDIFFLQKLNSDFFIFYISFFVYTSVTKLKIDMINQMIFWMSILPVTSEWESTDFSFLQEISKSLFLVSWLPFISLSVCPIHLTCWVWVKTKKWVEHILESIFGFHISPLLTIHVVNPFSSILGFSWNCQQFERRSHIPVSKL